MPPLNPPLPPYAPSSTVALSFAFAGDVASFPTADFESVLYTQFPQASNIDLVVSAASVHVDVTLTFLSVWDASNALTKIGKTTMESMQQTWFDNAGVGITLASMPEALVVRTPQPGVVWSSTVPGTRSLGMAWLVFLSCSMLACAVGFFVPRIVAFRASRGWGWTSDLATRTSRTLASEGQGSNRSGEAPPLGRSQDSGRFLTLSERSNPLKFSSRDLIDFLDSERSWFRPRKRTAKSGAAAMRRMRRRAYSMAACFALIFVILIGVWRARMAPIYDGTPYVPHVDAPPPPPPPISGFYALDASADPFELARRTNALCVQGSTGVLCATCEAGHYMSSGSRCVKCSKAEFEMHPVFVVALFLVSLLAVFYTWRYRTLKADARNKLFVIRIARRLRAVFMDSGLFKVSP